MRCWHLSHHCWCWWWDRCKFKNNIFDSNIVRLSSKIKTNEVSRCCLGEICPSADPYTWHIRDSGFCLKLPARRCLSETAMTYDSSWTILIWTCSWRAVTDNTAMIDDHFHSHFSQQFCKKSWAFTFEMLIIVILKQLNALNVNLTENNSQAWQLWIWMFK